MFSTTYNREEKLWKGRETTPLYNPNISLAQVLLNALKLNGPKRAQVFTIILNKLIDMQCNAILYNL